MGILTIIKTYASLIAGALLVVTVVGTLLYIKTLKLKIKVANTTIASQAVTIQGYALTSKIAQDVLTAHVSEATAKRNDTAALVVALQTTIPKTDEEARVWALQAAGRIQ